MKLWKKRVQFVKGYSTDPKVFEQVKAAAEGKAKVMVTLDSGHHKQLVAEELKLYCMLVTVGRSGALPRMCCSPPLVSAGVECCTPPLVPAGVEPSPHHSTAKQIGKDMKMSRWHSTTDCI
jgi:hypothetical protein